MRAHRGAAGWNEGEDDGDDTGDNQHGSDGHESADDGSEGEEDEGEEDEGEEDEGEEDVGEEDEGRESEGEEEEGEGDESEEADHHDQAVVEAHLNLVRCRADASASLERSAAARVQRLRAELYEAVQRHEEAERAARAAATELEAMLDRRETRRWSAPPS